MIPYASKLLIPGKILLLYGPRQVGKTTLAKMIAEANGDEYLWFNCDEAEARQMLEGQSASKLRAAFGKYKIVIFDEAQRLQDVGLILKIAADTFKDIKFIATGSSSFDLARGVQESMAGRYFEILLMPLALDEIHKTQFQMKKDLPQRLVYGNYPEIVAKPDIALQTLRGIKESYLYKDILMLGDIKRPDLLDNLLQALSYQVGQLVSLSELANLLKTSKETIDRYIDLLEKCFIIFRLRAYSSNQRNEIAKMDKIYFYDVGIRNALINNFNILENRNDVGQLWENFAITERMKQTHNLGKFRQYYFWRNYSKKEVDLVEVENTRLKLFEFKWKASSKLKSYRVPTEFANEEFHIVTQEDLDVILK